MFIISLVSYTAWQLLWASPSMYNLVSHPLLGILSSFYSYFQSVPSLSLNTSSFLFYYALSVFPFIFVFFIVTCISHFSTIIFLARNRGAQRYSESHSTASNDIDQVFQYHTLNTEHYLHEVMYAKMNESVDRHNVLRKLVKHTAACCSSRFRTRSSPIAATCWLCTRTVP